MQLLAAGGEPPAPDQRHLVGELIDLQLAAMKFLPPTRLLAGDLLDQLGGEFAQLLRVHRRELIVHLHMLDVATVLSLATANSQHSNRCLFADSLPRHADHQPAQLLFGDLHPPSLQAPTQAKRPWCSRRAHSQMPMPSCTSTLSRFARRLANT